MLNVQPKQTRSETKKLNALEMNTKNRTGQFFHVHWCVARY